MCAAPAEASQCRNAGGAWRRDVEDTKAFTLESRPRFVDAGGFDCARHNLAGRGSQSTNKLSHGSRFYLTRRISRSCRDAGVKTKKQVTQKEQVRKRGLPPLLGVERGQAPLPDLFHATPPAPLKCCARGYACPRMAEPTQHLT